MSSTCHLIVNGHSIQANIGETLVDAALGGWTVIPHDCCSGQCETCRVTVVGGTVDDQGTGEGRTVLACTATIEGDAEIEFDEVPRLAKRSGVVSKISTLAPDVVEVVVTLMDPFDYRPGQYFNVKFSGFPGRDLSPSVFADGTCGANELVFHIRRYPGGLVSTQIGATIRVGHRVHVRGPFGQAFLREGTGPIVLISGGTGWAPIWSVAAAARRTQRHRELIVIAGARNPQSLYMRDSLEWLVDDGVRDVVAATEVGAVQPLFPGLPTHYLPSLGLEDTVYVAGPPGLVDAVRTKARQGRARCYADPFLPGVQKLSMIDRMRQMLRAPAAQPVIAQPTLRPADAAYQPVLVEDRERRGAATLRPQPTTRPRGATLQGVRTRDRR
jgi:3-phenylpropionate/trans-cinnamate dioxygenase ferredoxin reductase subunit